MNEEQSDKVYLAARSLYRLNEMQKLSGPDFLLEKEWEILSKRFSVLSVNEMIYAMILSREFEYQDNLVNNVIDLLFGFENE